MKIVTASDGKEIDVDSCAKEYGWENGNLVSILYSTPFGKYYISYSWDESGNLVGESLLMPYWP